jgi:protein-S-isoprenylcysteine O-methyltransferase Ste14
MSKTKKEVVTETRTVRTKSGKREGFAFGRQNYLLLLVGIAVIAIGYMLMVGGGSDDPNAFNGEELFSFRRITLSPIVIVAGFVIIVVAIMKKPRPTRVD